MTEYILLLEIIMVYPHFLQIESCMLKTYEGETTRAGLSEGTLHAWLTISKGSETLCKMQKMQGKAFTFRLLSTLDIFSH